MSTLAKRSLNHWFRVQGKLMLLALMLLLPKSVQALQVKLSPDDPQLGDTISVLIQTDTPDSEPTVSAKQTSYPVFAQGQNSYRALLPTSPLDPSGKLTIQISGDDQTKNLAVWLRDRTFPTQRIWLSESKSGGATQTELEQVAAFKGLVSPLKLWQGAFLRPHAGRVSTGFGVRRYYNGVFATDYYHRGVDYAGSYGSTVVAPAAGRVELVGREAEGFQVHGNTIGIDHGQGVLSIFLHLQSIGVGQGEIVRAGQPLGTVGSSGASTGPHLHWGLYVHGVAVDPVPWRYAGID